jgi:hypothetical protein
VVASAKSRTTSAASGWRRRAESFFTDYPGVRIWSSLSAGGTGGRARMGGAARDRYLIK